MILKLTESRPLEFQADWLISLLLLMVLLLNLMISGLFKAEFGRELALEGGYLRITKEIRKWKIKKVSSLIVKIQIQTQIQVSDSRLTDDRSNSDYDQPNPWNRSSSLQWE